MKNQNTPAAVIRAFKHVRRFHPNISMVVFDKDGRWHFMTNTGEQPKFNSKIDIGILEDAVDSINDLPAFFLYPEILIDGPQDIVPGKFYINRLHEDCLYLAIENQQMIVIHSKRQPHVIGTFCKYNKDDKFNIEYWNAFEETESPFESSNIF